MSWQLQGWIRLPSKDNRQGRLVRIVKDLKNPILNNGSNGAISEAEQVIEGRLNRLKGAPQAYQFRIFDIEGVWTKAKNVPSNPKK